MNEQMTELDMYDPLPFDARLSMQEQEEDERFREQAGRRTFPFNGPGKVIFDLQQTDAKEEFEYWDGFKKP